MEKTYNFGFLFLDEIHHINHFITIAISLSQDHNVTILTYPGKHRYLRDTLERLDGENVIVKQLATHPFRAFTDILKKRKLPRKGFWMKKNRNHLMNSYDALFFTDYIHKKLLKYRGELIAPLFIKIPHGPAGRAYSYKEDLKDFDLHIIFGKHYKEQLSAQDLLGKKTKVVGYVKLDALANKKLPDLFAESRPIVIYNPHFDREVSSWYKLGIEVLNYFKDQTEFNLIFAPHINLFNKEDLANDINIINSFKNISHIYIDTGSIASVDMVYTKLADIYLGDVSSQSLEFISTPRPCVFINAHNVQDYENDHNFHFWRNGKVVNDTKGLQNALQTVDKDFEMFKPVQQASTKKDMKTKKKSTATDRAVKTILKLMMKQS